MVDRVQKWYNLVLMAEGFDIKSSSIEEISEKELKYGYWYISHKAQLAFLLRLTLILLSVGFYGYALVRLTIIYAFQQEEYARSLATAATDYINVLGVHEASRIQDLQVISRDVLPAGSGKVDIIARVKNPNTKWALQAFKYRFALGTKVYEAQPGFLLPGEEKFLMVLNVDGQAAGTPQLFIDEPQWKRVVLYENWGPDHLKFTIKDKQFITARQSEIGGQLPLSEVTATIMNDTAYNYNNVEVQVGLYSGSRLIGVNKVAIPDFLSGTSRPISARWTNNLAPITNVDLIPTVLILDEKAYKDFTGTFDPPFLQR